MADVLYAFSLTLVAGLATGVGGLIAFVRSGVSPVFLAVSLGFSAGAMLFVSLVELFDESRQVLNEHLGASLGGWAALASFAGGVLLIAVIDRLVPAAVNPHEPAETTSVTRERAILMRTGAFTAGAIIVHNIPEGFVTFVVALEDPSMAIPVAAAIALHNIPEGVAVAVPIAAATGSRRTGFTYAMVAGLAEPLGAAVGFLLLGPFLSGTVVGVALGAISGIMVFVSVDKLLPTAHRYDVGHIPVYGLVAGMILMGASLHLL